MSRKLTTLVVAVLPLLLLGRARPAAGGVHEVWDAAHFTKASTLEHVRQILDEIHSRFGKDLMIETFPDIPDHLKPLLQKDGKDAFYRNWAWSDADLLEVNGVIVLVTGDPRHLRVEVGKETRKRAFTLDDSDELMKGMGGYFHKNDFDGGLVYAAEFVRDRMARNMGGAASPASTQPTTRPTTQPTGTQPSGGPALSLPPP